MADTGWKSPGTVVDDPSYGTMIWAYPEEAKVSDNVYATRSGGRLGGLSHYLKATNFSMGVPAGATINGILVQIERKASAAGIADVRVRIVKATGAYGSEDKSAGAWSTSEAYYSYGGSGDKWSEAWTAANINDSDFGVGLAISADPAIVASVDHIRIKVYYTVAGTNIEINIADVWKDVTEIQINIGDSWKTVTQIQINIGDSWKTVFG